MTYSSFTIKLKKRNIKIYFKFLTNKQKWLLLSNRDKAELVKSDKIKII